MNKILEKLKVNLNDLIELLFEIGDYQLKKQHQVKVQSKSPDKNNKDSWYHNKVFSEVDLWSEKRLIEFFNTRFNSFDFSFITEEFHSKNRQNSMYYIIIDPLDGTKPYLKGENTFGISLGICTADEFLFGCNYYPAFNQLMYAFHNVDGVYNEYHQKIALPKTWVPNCSITSHFSYMNKDFTKMKHFLKSELGLTFTLVPDCATYRFKLMLEGALAAYFSENIFVWDIGPSSLLIEKVNILMINPLIQNGNLISALLNPPFMQTTFLAAPKDDIAMIGSKFRSFLDRHHI